MTDPMPPAVSPVCVEIEGACPRCDFSDKPVRYSNGEVWLRVTDLWSDGYGEGWGHIRLYSNSMEDNFDRGQGWNWNPEDWPFLQNTTSVGADIVMLGNIYKPEFFQTGQSNDFVSMFGNQNVLTKGTDVYNLLKTDGTLIVFNDENHATRPGLFRKRVLPGGETLEVTNETAPLMEVERSYTDGSGDTITEKFGYLFADSGPNENRVEWVKLERKVNNGSWTPISQVLYGYYGPASVKGSLGDLKLVTRQKWNGTAWETIDQSHYRYWLDGDQDGFKHGLKYVVGPGAFQKMTLDGYAPTDVDDTVIAQYADNYYEYDASRRAVKEITDGGTQTYTMAYAQATTSPNGFNEWYMKSTLTKPDTSEEIVFSNQYGETMLKIIKDGDDEWYEYHRYDDEGRSIWTASSSAISGYSESEPDLMGYDDQSDEFTYIRNTEG